MGRNVGAAAGRHHALDYADIRREDPNMPYADSTPGMDPLLMFQLAKLGQRVDGLLSHSASGGGDGGRSSTDFMEDPRATEGHGHTPRNTGGGPLPPVFGGSTAKPLPAEAGEAQLTIGRRDVRSAQPLVGDREAGESVVARSRRAEHTESKSGGNGDGAELLERLFKGLESDVLGVGEAALSWEESFQLRHKSSKNVSTSMSVTASTAQPLGVGEDTYWGDGAIHRQRPPSPSSVSSAAPSPKRAQDCRKCALLQEQVRALAQSLSGISAKVFNWVANLPGLAAWHRRELAEMLLEYVKPCAHIDDVIEGLVASLVDEAMVDPYDEVNEKLSSPAVFSSSKNTPMSHLLMGPAPGSIMSPPPPPSPPPEDKHRLQSSTSTPSASAFASPWERRREQRRHSQREYGEPVDEDGNSTFQIRMAADPKSYTELQAPGEVIDDYPIPYIPLNPPWLPEAERNELPTAIGIEDDEALFQGRRLFQARLEATKAPIGPKPPLPKGSPPWIDRPPAGAIGGSRIGGRVRDNVSFSPGQMEEQREHGYQSPSSRPGTGES